MTDHADYLRFCNTKSLKIKVNLFKDILVNETKPCSFYFTAF